MARRRRIVVLGPMPLEMKAIVKAFGLTRAGDDQDGPWVGQVGDSDVTAIHIGMGPATARKATAALFEGDAPPHHVMIAGICGGLDRDVAVGTLINPELVVDHTTGATFRHHPPGDMPTAGKLITTEGVTLDLAVCQRFFEDGCIGVDMETSAVAQVCDSLGVPWSVYRCISDRPFDGLLDERLVAMTKPDGSGDVAAITKLLADEPDLAARLEQLNHDTTLGARLAAEAALRGCRALDT
jgi:nucleoside phosphorylase